MLHKIAAILAAVSLDHPALTSSVLSAAYKPQMIPPYTITVRKGLRGQGSPFAGFAHNVDIATYVKTANETTIVCVQIESRQGVDNVDAICAVPGVGKSNLLRNSPPFVRS